MGSLRDIHTVAMTELKKRFSLNNVVLKHPFPERPLRLLGLVKIEGDVLSSEKFSRVVMMRSFIYAGQDCLLNLCETAHGT